MPGPIGNSNPAGIAHAAITRLARRPQGVTNADVQEALSWDAKTAGSRLGQMTRTGKLRKVAGTPMRWYPNA